MKRYHTDYCCGDETALVATDSEWSTIVNALRTAARTYERISDAAFVPHGHADVVEDVVGHFRRQAAEALRLADKIAEEAGV